jgi:hypothetical protein
MLRRISEIVVGRMLIITASLMLVGAGLVALAVVPASAATQVVVSYWGSNHYEDNDSTYQCGRTWEWRQGANALDEVYNPCNTRVWVHYYSTGTDEIQQFCVNPNGGLAYDFPASELHWSSSVTFSDIQLTSNTLPCDSGQAFSVAWENDDSQITSFNYPCETFSAWTPNEFVEEAINANCSSRLWLHYNTDGSGASYCISPEGKRYQPPADGYFQVSESANQAPCTAGGPPYPY